MCLTVLPHRASEPGEVWSRSNANASLEVHPLRDVDAVLCVPATSDYRQASK
jgi:hypothetical protein